MPAQIAGGAVTQDKRVEFIVVASQGEDGHALAGRGAGPIPAPQSS